MTCPSTPAIWAMEVNSAQEIMQLNLNIMLELELINADQLLSFQENTLCLHVVELLDFFGLCASERSKQASNKYRSINQVHEAPDGRHWGQASVVN